jgi:competence protein ComEA
MHKKSAMTAMLFLFIFGFLCVSFPAAPQAGSSKSKTSPQAQTQGKQPALKGKTININKATTEELVKNVPLLTPELAKRIVQYRKDNGDFQTLEELLQVEGFNRDLLRKLKPFLLLEGVGGEDCTC